MSKLKHAVDIIFIIIVTAGFFGSIQNSYATTSQKVCSAVTPGLYRNDIVVPETWNASNCLSWAQQIGLSNGQLGCLAHNSIDYGDLNGSKPVDGCWGIEPVASTSVVGFTGVFAASNWTTSGVASYAISETNLTSNVSSGGGGVTASMTIPASGTISFDWNMAVYRAGDYGDAIRYGINGTYYDLTTIGSASGVAAEITVSAGDVFEILTWGTTKSSSYSAVINNFIFTESEPVIGFTGDFSEPNWTITGVASYNMSETELTSNVGSGGGGVLATITIPTDGTISFDWNMAVYRAGDYGDAIRYGINSTYYDLTTIGSASGVTAEITVSAGDVFEILTWGTTKSSSYSAVINNFIFTPN